MEKFYIGPISMKICHMVRGGGYRRGRRTCVRLYVPYCSLIKSRLFFVSNLLLASSRRPIIFNIRDCRAIVNGFSCESMNIFVCFPAVLLSKLNKIAVLGDKMNN